MLLKNISERKGRSGEMQKQIVLKL